MILWYKNFSPLTNGVRMHDFKDLEEKLGVSFRNKDLLYEALTHKSYRNENRRWPYPNNERLEFLGDAVLELVVTEYLFLTFADKPEGELTNLRAALVNGQFLSKIGDGFDLGSFLLLSRGESKDTGRARTWLVANAMEAIIGALYLDQGPAVAKEFIDGHILSRMVDILKNGIRDAKSILQERVQSFLKITPTYRIMEETGPDHDKWFIIGIFFGDEFVATGGGNSKREAEIQAATEALSVRGWLT